MSSYYGDGNSYRGAVCRESQTPTIAGAAAMTADHIAELERRIEHLERAFVAVSELPTDNTAYSDTTWWYNKGWNDALKEMRKWTN